ncbi:MAG: hypothetical protein SOU51_05380 [Collinsella sp.]|nr:hypothetical protein [Collinsella sp.]
MEPKDMDSTFDPRNRDAGATEPTPFPDPRPDAPMPVPAEVPENIEATIDFSEVEFAEEFAEPVTAVTPRGVLPLEPAPIEGRLRKAPLSVPSEIEECSGFTLFGRRIKSLLYTTDVAVIRNSNADAIFAVYPFTAQPAITQALLTVAECPVFVGVGGGTTAGKRSVQLAAVSEMQGAAGVIVNSPASPEMVEQIASMIDIPVIATVVRCDELAHAKVRAGAKVLNVAAGKDTPAVLRQLREHYPNMPLIASGGRSSLSVRETREAGANAVIWTPPSAQQLQADMMKRYREAGASPDGPIIDPVKASAENPLESARADVPIPDELIAKAHSPQQRPRKGRPGFFFPRVKGRKGVFALIPALAALFGSLS